MILIFLCGGIVRAQSNEDSMLFAKVNFTSRFFKEYNEYFSVPTFDSKIKSFKGTEITFRRNHLPMDLEIDSVMLLAKYPYSQCFIYVGAGRESVAEIVVPAKHPKLKADQIITVFGKLS